MRKIYLCKMKNYDKNCKSKNYIRNKNSKITDKKVTIVTFLSPSDKECITKGVRNTEDELVASLNALFISKK